MKTNQKKLRNDMVHALDAIIKYKTYNQYEEDQRRKHKKRIGDGSWLLLMHAVMQEDFDRDGCGTFAED